MNGPTDADRAKAAELLRVSDPDELDDWGACRDAIAAALAAERAAAVADLRARVRDWIGDVAFRPNDIVLGQTAVTADQLPDLHRLLDALDPEWRDWTDGAKRDRRRAAVTDTTGGTQ